MSTSSSEEGSGMTGHYATSSGLESTGSLLFSLPSDSSDAQTEITPPASPAPCEGQMRTPRDILDASRRLGQISALALQSDVTPTKASKQFHHRAPPKSVVNDEAGYDADGDGDGDVDADDSEGTRAGAGPTATMRPTRRPAFLRIDTRQHRRVASMLATRRPSPGFGDTDPQWHMDVSRPPRAKLVPLTPISLKASGPTGKPECYELRLRPKAGPVGLGIGFPENHPLRGRAFTMPAAVSPVADSAPGLEEMQGTQAQQGQRFEWLPSPIKWKKTTQVGVCAPSPVRLALRPTFLEVSPSPIESLPARGGGSTFRYGDDLHDRSEISDVGQRDRCSTGILRCDAEMERKRDALARKGQTDLSKSEMPAVTLPC